MRLSLILWLLLAIGADAQENPLAPIRTDNPRDTLRSFMETMASYRAKVEVSDSGSTSKLNDAVRTLDLAGLPSVIRREKGREAAILLKEVIDRVIVIDYALVPDYADGGAQDYWRLRGTEITIRRIKEGERAGEYLFSQATVERLPLFYQKVKHLPYKTKDGGAMYQRPWVELNLPEWWAHEMMGAKMWQWLGLFISIFLGLLGRVIAGRALMYWRRVLAKTGMTSDLGFLERSRKPMSFICASIIWYVSLQFLQFDGLILSTLSVLIQLLLSFSIIWLAYGLSGVASEFLVRWTERNDFPIDEQLIPLITRALRLFIVVFGFLIAIQNLGVNVMSLLAGLGLGGLAFALAFKDTAANLFGSIMILWDKPFTVGDWIVAQGVEGTVEEIGFRSTRVRTFYNSLISVPNSSLASVHVDNMGLRQFRRVRTVIGITYDTPPEKVEAFLEGIKQVIRANSYTRKDYFHVVFNDFGGSSLNIMLYFFLKVPDWSNELVERQNVLLEILRLAHSLGVSFAFPSQSVYVESMPGVEGSSKALMPNEDLVRAAKSFGPGGDASRPQGLGLYTAPFKETFSGGKQEGS